MEEEGRLASYPARYLWGGGGGGGGGGRCLIHVFLIIWSSRNEKREGQPTNIVTAQPDILKQLYNIFIIELKVPFGIRLFKRLTKRLRLFAQVLFVIIIQYILV